MSLETKFWTIIPAPDGNQYSAYPSGVLPGSVAWSQVVPNFPNETASLTVNIISTYLTFSGAAPTVTLNGALPTGWSFDGTTLAYNGTGVGTSGQLSFTATQGTTVVNSNAFTVQGSGVGIPDNSPPTIPLALSVVSVTPSQSIVSAFASSDPNPPGKIWHGLGPYDVLRTPPGVIVGTIASPLGLKPVLTLADISPGAVASTLSQSGADLTISTQNVDPSYPISDGVGFAQMPLTGTNWVFSCRIDAFTAPDPGANIRLEARTSLDPGSAYVAIVLTAFAAGRILSEARPNTGAAAVEVKTVNNTKSPAWLFLIRAGDTYSYFYSLDGNALIPLGTVTQAMGNTLNVGVGGNTNNGVRITFTVKDVNLQTLGTIQYTDNAVVPGPYTYQFRATDMATPPNKSVYSAPLHVTVPTAVNAGADNFPRLATLWDGGPQLYDSSYQAYAAKNHINVIGGGYASWESDKGKTKESVIRGIKNQSTINSRVFQFWQLNQANRTASSGNPIWDNKVISMNWWLYVQGTSGTIVADAWAPGLGVVNVTSAAPLDPSTGLGPYKWGAKLANDMFHLGLYAGTSAAPSLDGFVIDNYDWRPRYDGDWLRNNTTQSQNDATTQLNFRTGEKTWTDQLTAVFPSAAANGGNIAQWYPLNGNNSVQPLNPSIGFYEAAIGDANSVETFAGSLLFQQTMQFDLANLSGAKYLIVQHDFVTATGGDNYGPSWQAMRYGLCGVLMNNGYYNAIMSSILYDETQRVWFEEFDGGALNKVGYLGQPSATAQGAAQTAAWSQGVWRRDFANGIALWNPKNNGVKTVALGSTFNHIKGSEPGNTGAATASVTLQDRDGVILLRPSGQASSDNYPRLGAVMTGGSQAYGTTWRAYAAKLHIVIINGAYDQWEQFTGYSKQTIISSIKSQSKVSTRVFQFGSYNNVNLVAAGSANPEIVNKVNAMNWWLYVQGTSGTKVADLYPGTLALVNMTSAAPLDSATGLGPFGWIAKFSNDLYHLGSYAGTSAAPSLDGFYIDNVFWKPREDGDWLRNGTTQSQNDSTTQLKFRTGQQTYFGYLAGAFPSGVHGGNIADWWPGNGANSTQPLSLGLGLIESIIGESYSTETTAGSAAVQQQYQFDLANLANPKYAIFSHDNVTATGSDNYGPNWQAMRYGLTAALMNNGYYFANTSFNYLDSPADCLWFDEYDGGSLANVGYLGQPLSAPQTAAWSQGVWRRDFANGSALWNPKGNGAKTVALGGTFYHLRGTEPGNTGASTTSVTLQDRDGVILLRSAPP